MSSSYQPQGTGPATFTTAPRWGVASFATQRPWRELTDLSSISCPISLGEAITRIHRNLAYFRINYTAIVLVIVFLSLLWHPLSMIVFLVILVAWGSLYFSRDDPLVVLGRTINDRLVLSFLGIVTLVALISTSVWFNLIVSLLIGFAIVLVHAAFRGIEDQYTDYYERGDGGSLTSVVGSSPSLAGVAIPWAPVVYQ